LSTGDDGTVRLWDPRAGRLIHSFEVPGSRLDAVGRLNAKTIMAKVAAPEDRIIFWNTATGKVRRSLKGAITDKLTAFEWSPNGRFLATGHADHTVRNWDAFQGKALHTLRGPASSVLALAWSRDGKHLAACTSSRQILTWETETGKPGRALAP